MTETRRTCVLSMARLLESTARFLFDTPTCDWPVHGGAMGPHMLTVHTGETGTEGKFPDLDAVLSWARKRAFDYVMLDQDVDPLEDGCDLPIAAYLLPPDAAPAGGWRRRAGVFWGADYSNLDAGGQRMAIVEDSKRQPVAWVLYDEDDPAAETALSLIESAPKTARQHADLVEAIRRTAAEAEAYDEKMCGGADGAGESRPPRGEDYNEMLARLRMIALAAGVGGQS